MSRTRRKTLAFLLLELSPFVLFLKLISCPLCNSNTLQNILMVFGRNADQDKMICCVQEWQLCLFYSWALSPFVIFDSDYALISCPPFRIFLWYYMILGRNIEQEVTKCHIQEWQLWVSYFWSYLPFLCLNLISCPLCNMNILRNILMILNRNVEQDEITCCILEWQLWLSYFWSYLLFLCLNLISCLLCNSSTLWIILILLGRNVEQDETTCCIQEWQLWLSYFWSYRPFLCLNLILYPLCNLNTLHNILMILGRNVEQDKMTCHLQEWQLLWG